MVSYVAVQGEQKASEESSLVKHELEEAGFVVNQKKSHWTPTKSMEWLGFNIDLAKGEFSVPAHKLEAFRSLLHAVAEVPTVPARRLASVVGKIMSMSLALGPVTRLMTRNLYFVLNQRFAWCQNLRLTPEASQELTFWMEEISKFNGRNIWPKPSAVRMVYSDASDSGYGGYVVEHGNLVTNGQWSEHRPKKVLHGVNLKR